MNILALTDYYLPHSGGSRVYYHNLYKNLVASFPDTVTVLTKKVPGWQEFDRQHSTDSLRIRRRSKPLITWKYQHLPKIVFPLAHALQFAKHADLLHCGDLYPPGVIGLLLKRAANIPYLIFCHGDEITQTDCRRYQPRVRDQIYRDSAAVVAANEFAYQRLLRLGIGEQKVFKVTPGVDLERFTATASTAELAARLGLNGKSVILSVGRLVPKKGYPVVLEAVARIAAGHNSLRYLIAGDGPERSRLEALASHLGLQEIVTFLGDVPQEKLPDLYSACDVFVLANRYAEGDVESFGMVFLEAGAAGKPVVGGRSGGTAEAVLEGVTGLLIDPDDVQQLATVLQQLLGNPAMRRHMGEAGLQRVRAEFNWQSRAEALREISWEIARRRTRSMENRACATRA